MEAAISRARDDLAELVNQVVYKHERVTLTRRGKAQAALVSVDDLALLEELEDKLDIAEADAARLDERVSLEDLKAELGL